MASEAVVGKDRPDIAVKIDGAFGRGNRGNAGHQPQERAGSRNQPESSHNTTHFEQLKDSSSMRSSRLTITLQILPH